MGHWVFLGKCSYRTKNLFKCEPLVFKPAYMFNNDDDDIIYWVPTMPNTLGYFESIT